MTQPKFAPIGIEDEVRPTLHLEQPTPWRPHRPAEFNPSKRSTIGGRGFAGPDQGYALGLAEKFASSIELTAGEHRYDALLAGCLIGLRRASRIGRAPIRADIEFGLTVLGYLGDAPADLVAWRKSTVAGIDHDYGRQRTLVGAVAESTFAMSVEVVRANLSDWRSLVGAR